MYITTIEKSDYRPLGSANYPAYSLYQSLFQMVSHRVSSEAASIFSEPLFDEGTNTIDYASRIEGEAKKLTELTKPQQVEAFEQLKLHARKVKQLSDALVSNSDQELARFGKILTQSLCVPSVEHIYVINGYPVLTAWGFEDRHDPKFMDVTQYALDKEEPIMPPSEIKRGSINSERKMQPYRSWLAFLGG